MSTSKKPVKNKTQTQTLNPDNYKPITQKDIEAAREKETAPVIDDNDLEGEPSKD